MRDTADVHIRVATTDDAATVARLHATSWRRHYRGAYADAYLDGDVVADRLAVWAQRLAAPAGTLTLLAEAKPYAEFDGAVMHADAEAHAEFEDKEGEGEGAGAETLGFIHLVLDHDPAHGSLIDNLHITPTRQRTGVGRTLLALAADAAARQADHLGLYLWVLEQNDAAQNFYRALGGTIVEKATVSDPGGVPGRLVGSPIKLRCVWPDASAIQAISAISGISGIDTAAVTAISTTISPPS